MKRLPIGISDYKRLIEEDYYYVDKTLLIKELLAFSGQVTLIARPRRFGKTLNISMLRYFFEKTSIDHSHLFAHTAIWQEEERKFFAQYPVIFLTFKDVKELTWKVAYKKITAIIADEFLRHSYLQETLSERHAFLYKSILNDDADQATYSRSLLLLSELLATYHNKRPIILIDEYDAPIHSAYLNEYYNELITFMRSILSSALKDNSFIETGILTGILRTAKESVFSGLNNLKVCTVTHSEFQDKFGFTEVEIKTLLKDQKLPDKAQEVKAWYDGYTFGSTTIYNPWSMIQCCYERGLLKTYWLNTSDNELIKRLLILADEELKSEFELLLTQKTIIKEIDDAVIFPGIENNNKAIWSLLLFSGYLTYSQQELFEGAIQCTLKIPNNEIKIVYTNLMREIFEKSLTYIKTKQLLQALVEGNGKIFQALLQEFMLNTISFYDLPSSEPEKSYHLFILGLLVQFGDIYEIKSNRESGYGRYDIMLIPYNLKYPGIVMEFKKVSELENETLKTAAQKALSQIKKKEYITELKDKKIKNINLFGIAFAGKKVLVINDKS